jgi:hypothetical protein
VWIGFRIILFALILRGFIVNVFSKIVVKQFYLCVVCKRCRHRSQELIAVEHGARKLPLLHEYRGDPVAARENKEIFNCRLRLCFLLVFGLSPNLVAWKIFDFSVNVFYTGQKNIELSSRDKHLL